MVITRHVFIPRPAISKGTNKVLPSVWERRRKRCFTTNEEPYKKWKARLLNLHGGKQEHSVNFWET
jgi:hypothetical protein